MNEDLHRHYCCLVVVLVGIVFVVDDDDFTHSAQSLMKEIPGIQARAKIAIVWLMPQNITRKFQSTADPGKVGRNGPVIVFVLAGGTAVFFTTSRSF